MKKIIIIIFSFILIGCFDSHDSKLTEKTEQQSEAQEITLLPKFINELEKEATHNKVNLDRSDKKIGYFVLNKKRWEFLFDDDNSIKRIKSICRHSTNHLISIHIKSMPLKVFFNYFSEFIDRNIIVAPSVEGDISIEFKNLSWKQALMIILQSKSLAERNIGNAIYVAPLSEISEYDKKQQELSEKAPMKTLMYRLNYAKATDVIKLLQDNKQSLLPKQGHAAVDERTNSILVRASEQQLTEIKSFLKQLDIPVPQVLIEARIVNLDDDCEKELGVRFGITSGHHLTGSLDGASEMAGGKSPANVKPEDRLNVDLPALNSHAGKMGLALFKLTGGTSLDLELSALESEGRAEIISNPKLMTANQQPATIEAGEEIPYQESVAQGVTSTSFKKAVLRLEVTPQITPDKKIILHLKVNQDKRSSQEIKGVPAIDTRHINTQIVVEDGQTVVLGGIYEHTKTNGEERIPFFADLPIFGVLFRHEKTINNRRELLIFVTPNIVNTE